MSIRLPSERVALLLVGAVSAYLCATLPLFSQETYYWSYAQRLDLSYYDHPPMVAWLIWLGTSLWGDGAIGVRFGTWLCGMTTTYVGARWLRVMGWSERSRSLWTLMGLVSPILVMPHFLANPDSPLVAGWTVTLFALWRAREGGARWWLLAGAAAGFALLGKYTAAFLAVGGVAVLLLDPHMRRQLTSPKPYLAVLIAALVFAPAVHWNVANDFASFRFQTEHRIAKADLGMHWFLNFTGGQVGLLHPVVALASLVAIAWGLRRAWRGDRQMLWLVAFSLPLPVYMLCQSLWIQIKPNWVAPAYVGLTMLVVAWWREVGDELLAKRAVRFAVGSLLLVPVLLPLAPLVRVVPPGKGSSYYGWPEIAVNAEKWEDAVDVEDGVEGNMFFFAADYRDAAQLGYALWHYELHEEPTETKAREAVTAEEPTLAHNVLGFPALQYDYWDSPRTHKGEHAVLVLARPDGREHIIEEAKKRFESIQHVERLPIRCLGRHLFDVDFYVCRNYRGPIASD